MDINSILSEIKNNIATDTASRIELKEQTFLDGLLKERAKGESIFRSVRLNAFIFFSLCVIMLAVIASMIPFFLRNVMFFPHDYDMNSQGAMRMMQPCGKEQYVYLFNTAKCWDDTGIYIVEGDRVDISYSGNFFSNIQWKEESARLNKVHRYDAQPMREKFLQKYCMLKNQDFGIVMYQICKETDKRAGVDRPIIKTAPFCVFPSYRKKGETYEAVQHIQFTAPQSGKLYVTVNDIYLNDATKDSILHSKLTQKYLNLNDIDSFKKEAEKYPEMWYYDNIGEMLLNVTVTRHRLHGTFFINDYFGYFYRGIDNVYNHSFFFILVMLLALITTGIAFWYWNRYCN